MEAVRVARAILNQPAFAPYNDGELSPGPGVETDEEILAWVAADASVFPYAPTGNIYAPVMMVAEKAADLIAGNTPLAASDVPYYRYRDDMPLYPPGDPRHEPREPTGATT